MRHCPGTALLLCAALTALVPGGGARAERVKDLAAVAGETPRRRSS